MNKLLFLALIPCLLVTGCSTHQGIPTHGGGKRFDEEQRLISASIAKAVAKIDLSAFKGKTLRLDLIGLETSGAGSSRYASNEMMFEPHLAHEEVNEDQTAQGSRITQTPNGQDVVMRTVEKHSEQSIEPIVKYRQKPVYTPERYLTTQDVEYLKSVVMMKAHFAGVTLVERGKADGVLTVLVDVLGTNCIVYDAYFYMQEELSASCELTYYVADAKSNVVLDPVQVAGSSEYSEHSVLFTNFNKVTRQTANRKPLMYHRPVSGGK